MRQHRRGGTAAIRGPGRADAVEHLRPVQRAVPLKSVSGFLRSFPLKFRDSSVGKRYRTGGARWFYIPVRLGYVAVLPTVLLPRVTKTITVPVSPFSSSIIIWLFLSSRLFSLSALRASFHCYTVICSGLLP